ncbi:prepilin-type N-terminal cleavage/methylation domain-containing protein [Desulforhopalus vacuolatus]|uniref:prepilin-type N-terminal cleavage/methylation domain-containing protein n=1 Tax=Desulforhopalus vacuolatus TaxID=40414 RepID=UPI001962B68B|nr:prepilin-type N-terminal cleavage/methylation domain-containing protein [Desulforhopalus vacuolatus]MBM9521189.1 prepilin-type N-terminal cleavage/methylation domain-containing protein [Desulforhopalus vacuolatus]
MKKISNRGFTLIELMITLAMAGIIVAAVYAVYTVQSRAYGKQEQIFDIQQTLSAAVFLMSRDIRMAGFQPEDGTGSKPGFTAATATTLTFGKDLDGDGTLVGSEETTYEFHNAAKIADRKLTRNIGSGDQTLGENIEAVEFLYTLADGTSTTTATAELKNIRAVTISVLGIAATPDASFTNENTYTPGSNLSGINFSGTVPTTWPNGTKFTAANDHYRRRMLITTINCRNMGL